MFSIRKFATAGIAAAGLALSIITPSAGASELDSYGQEAPMESGFEAQTFNRGCKDYSGALGSSISASSVVGNTATFTVVKGACPVKLSFTTYTLPGGSVMPFQDQIPVDSKTASYGPGSYTVQLGSLPCNWQADLYFGEIQPHLNASYGHSGLVPGGRNRAYDYSERNNCGTTSVVPAGVCVYRGSNPNIGVFQATNSGTSSATLPAGAANKVDGGSVFFQATEFVPGVTNPSAVADVRELGNGWMSATYTLDGRTAVVNNDTANCDTKPLSADAGNIAIPLAGAAGLVAFAGLGLLARRRSA